MDTSRDGGLSGALLPWHKGAPIYLRSSTPDQYYVPCFTKIDDLRSFLLRAHVFEYKVKQIGVGSEFIQSFEGSNIRVVLNPTHLPEDQLQIVEYHVPAVDRKIPQC